MNVIRVKGEHCTKNNSAAGEEKVATGAIFTMANNRVDTGGGGYDNGDESDEMTPYGDERSDQVIWCRTRNYVDKE